MVQFKCPEITVIILFISIQDYTERDGFVNGLFFKEYPALLTLHPAKNHGQCI
jgi:hypothetical protein